jgi:hypothetical protein
MKCICSFLRTQVFSCMGLKLINKISAIVGKSGDSNMCVRVWLSGSLNV